MSQYPLDFVVFYVADLEDSLRYFTKKLGFTALPPNAGDQPTFRAITGGQEGIGYGLLQVTDSRQPRPGAVELYFRVPDLATLRDELSGRGVAATPISERPFGLIFTVHTPDGTPITMLSHP
jgi:catechol 2,3-dioxygenase-like lactoylglutathione lyase family enzyme